MNLQWAKVFIGVLDSGSFAAAARQLHMSQPAVSMAIAAMEKELGELLLVRTSGQRSAIRPTHAGEIYRDYCIRFLKLYDEMQVELVQERSFLPFTVATSPTPGSILLPLLKNSFHAAYPKISYQTKAFSGNELLSRLRLHEADMIITGTPAQDNDLLCERFFYDPMELICPKSMQLPSCITLRQLQKLPLVIRNQNCNTMAILVNALKREGISLSDMNVTIQVYGNTDVLQAVSLGTGVGFVTRSLLSAMPHYCENVQSVSVKRLQLDRHLHLIRLKNSNFSNSAKLFWDHALGTRWREGKFSYNTSPK